MINYAIPPLTPQEALEWIENSGEHQFGYCSDGYDACDCAQKFVGVVLGRPWYHDRPVEAIVRVPGTPFRAGGVTHIAFREDAKKRLADWSDTWLMKP